MSYMLPQLRLPSDMENTNQLNELKAASAKFLGNIKVRFGGQAVRLFKVHETLDLFSKRELSKRETHKIIFDTLEGQEDLRQEFSDILMHPAARWRPDEFDLPAQHPTQPSQETVPQFLQPAHEPRIRLPSFLDWSPFSHDEHSTSLTMFNGYSGFSRQPSWVLSPSLPLLPALQPQIQPTERWVEESIGAAYDTELYDGKALPLSVHTTFHDPWQASDCAEAWAIGDTGFLADGTDLSGLLDLQTLTAPPLNHGPRASLTYLQQAEPHTAPTLLPVETPPVLHAHDPTSGSTPPEVEFEEPENPNTQAPLTPRSQSSSSTSRMVDTADATEADQGNIMDRNQSMGNSFVHVLCGKGFASAMSVKKHHWGKRIGDHATTTGCWAKHKKPDTAWDDHPSCKAWRSTPVTTNALSRVSQQSRSEAPNWHHKSPIAIDTPQLDLLPEFSAFDAMPHTVAKIANSSHATASSAQEPDAISHTHQLVTHGSFDNLLTAVNVVSQIEAPKPESPAESIALHLTAQVAAAEQHRQFTPWEASTSTCDRPRFRSIALVAQDTNETVMQESADDTLGDFTRFGTDKQSLVLPSDVEETYGVKIVSQLFQPTRGSLSIPARKKRKV